MTKSTTVGTMRFDAYFEAFDDIKELKKAAKLWVSGDIRRLKRRDRALRRILEIGKKADAKEQLHIIMNIALKGLEGK